MSWPSTLIHCQTFQKLGVKFCCFCIPLLGLEHIHFSGNKLHKIVVVSGQPHCLLGLRSCLLCFHMSREWYCSQCLGLLVCACMQSCTGAVWTLTESALKVKLERRMPCMLHLHRQRWIWHLTSWAASLPQVWNSRSKIQDYFLLSPLTIILYCK